MAKRANGMGGVAFDRPSGLWRARLTVDGRRVVRYAAEQKEAWALLDDMRRRAAEGLDVRADRVTVAEYLAGWLDGTAALKVRGRTLEGYRQHVRDHLGPALGRLTLASLSAGHVQRLVKDKTAAGLSPATVKRLHATLRVALADAERKGLISRNVARFVTLPKEDRPAIEAMEPERARAILEAVKGHRLEALYVLAMLTGLRQGELLGLPWKAVDLTAGKLTVAQALSQRRGGPPVLAPPKTKRSRRTLPIPPDGLAALRAHGERQRFEERKAGAGWQNSAGLVFVAEDGAPMDPSTVTRGLGRCLAAAGLPSMRVHDLRHSTASVLLEHGVHVSTVAQLLGHANASITLNTYSHVIARLVDSATAALAGLLTPYAANVAATDDETASPDHPRT